MARRRSGQPALRATKMGGAMVSVAQLNEMAAIAAELEAQDAYESALLDCIERMVGFDVAFFKRNGVPGPVVRGLDGLQLTAAERALFDCRDEAQSVLDMAVQRRGVAVDLDVLGQRGLERLRYYEALMKPVGGRSSALLPVLWRGRNVSTLVIGRARPHHAREVELMEQFAPTLQLCEASRQARWDAAAPRTGAVLSLEAALTASERDVLAYLPLGYTNFDIACARGT